MKTGHINHAPVFGFFVYLSFCSVKILADYEAGFCVYYVPIVGDGAGELDLVAHGVADLDHLGGKVVCLFLRDAGVGKSRFACGGIADIVRVAYNAAAQRRYHDDAKQQHDYHLRCAAPESAASVCAA